LPISDAGARAGIRCRQVTPTAYPPTTARTCAGLNDAAILQHPVGNDVNDTVNAVTVQHNKEK
jgi:hypothetical protein